MKKRRIPITIATLLLLFSLLLTGCAKGAPGNGGTGETGGFVSASGNRKIVYSASLTLTVKDADAGVNAVTALLPEGSYLESRTVYDDRAYLVLRVKTEDFDALLSALSGAGKVSSLSQTAEDVTDAYASLVRKQEALLAERSRLLTLMESESSETVVKYILPQLTEVETSLSEIDAQLNGYDDRIDYSRISVTVTETGGTAAKIEFKNALLSGWNFLKSAFFFLINVILFLLPIAAVALVVALPIVFLSKKKKRRKAASMSALSQSSALAGSKAAAGGATLPHGKTGSLAENDDAPAPAVENNHIPAAESNETKDDDRAPDRGNPYAKR